MARSIREAVDDDIGSKVPESGLLGTKYESIHLQRPHYREVSVVEEVADLRRDRSGYQDWPAGEVQSRQ